VKQVLLAFARAAGATPDVTVAGSGTEQVEVRRLVGDHTEFLFAFNHSAQVAEATISVAMPWGVREARSVNQAQPVSRSESQGRTVLKKQMAGGEIWVVRLDRK
jgi:hypothetical protein